MKGSRISTHILFIFRTFIARILFGSSFLLAGLLSVRYAPVSKRSKACIEAKAKQQHQKRQTKPTKDTTTAQKPTTTKNTKTTRSLCSEWNKWDSVHTEQVKQMLHGKLARQATRAWNDHAEGSQLQIYHVKWADPNSQKEKPKQTKKHHKTKTTPDPLIGDVKSRWDNWEAFRAKAGPHSNADA